LPLQSDSNIVAFCVLYYEMVAGLAHLYQEFIALVKIPPAW